MEEWRAIPGYEGIYEVSDQGRIRSIRRAGAKGCILALQKAETGYIRISLNKNGKAKMMYVHRLVLTAHVGLCPEGMECCHGDGDKANNNIENLRWDTPENNQLDRRKHNMVATGERNGRAVLTEAQVHEIRLRHSNGKSGITLAAEFGVHPSTIGRVIQRRIWTGV